MAAHAGTYAMLSGGSRWGLTKIWLTRSYTSGVDTHAHPLVGQLVDGRYRVEEYVARGGMATVYRAMDLRLDRVVALKVMHSGLAEDPEFVERFVREARSAARLSHPAIVAVYDQRSTDGLVYLAMEYVSGGTLRDLLNQEGRLDPPTALAVIEPVLAALTAAHRAGFVHRDIKPENVLLADDGRIKVADFGLARAIAASTSSALTRGLLIGTVAYLAPEQVQRGIADARADVYSAGIVLYECLIGQTPFTGETPLSVAYQHVHARVPVPSSIRPEIPASVDALVATATKPEPGDRYADASDFVQHLQTVQALIGVPTNAHTIVLDRNQATVTVGPWATSVMTRGMGATSTPTAVRTPPPVVQSSGPSGPSGPGGPIWPYPPQEPPVTVKRRRSRWFLRILIAFVILALIGAGAGYGAWRWSKAQIVTVPSVLGMSQNQATAKLSAAEMSLNVSGQDYSKTVPKGAIISSDPAAGTQVRKGQLVTVHTSAGPETVSTPKVTRLVLDQAVAIIKAARLEPRSTEEYHDTIAEGKVISAAPKKGSVVEVGTVVDLVVSKGPPPVQVPRVLGMSRSSAVATLQAAGLKVVVRNQLPVVVLGRVYSQDPGPSTVRKGSTVTISMV